MTTKIVVAVLTTRRQWMGSNEPRMVLRFVCVGMDMDTDIRVIVSDCVGVSRCK